MLDPELEHGGERLPLSAWADRCGFTDKLSADRAVEIRHVIGRGAAARDAVTTVSALDGSLCRL